MEDSLSTIPFIFRITIIFNLLGCYHASSIKNMSKVSKPCINPINDVSSDDSDFDDMPGLIYNETDYPSLNPIPLPTIIPTNNPTSKPTRTPTYRPTRSPTSKPTKTRKPTKYPTFKPTRTPTKKPTQKPTHAPQNAQSKQDMMHRKTHDQHHDHATIKFYAVRSDDIQTISQYCTHLITHHPNDFIVIDNYNNLDLMHLNIKRSLLYLPNHYSHIPRVFETHDLDVLLASKLNCFCDIMKDIHSFPNDNETVIQLTRVLTSWIQYAIGVLQTDGSPAQLKILISGLKQDDEVNQELVDKINNALSDNSDSFEWNDVMNPDTICSIISFYGYAASLAYDGIHASVLKSLKQNEWIPKDVYVNRTNQIRQVYNDALVSRHNSWICRVLDGNESCVEKDIDIKKTFHIAVSKMKAYIIGDLFYSWQKSNRSVVRTMHVVVMDTDLDELRPFINCMVLQSNCDEIQIEDYAVYVKQTLTKRRTYKRIEFQIVPIIRHLFTRPPTPHPTMLRLPKKHKKKKKKQGDCGSIKLHYVPQQMKTVKHIREEEKGNNPLYLVPYENDMKNQSDIGYTSHLELVYGFTRRFVEACHQSKDVEQLIKNTLDCYPLFGTPFDDDMRWMADQLWEDLDNSDVGSCKLRVFLQRALIKRAHVDFLTLDDDIILDECAIKLFIKLMERSAVIALEMSEKQMINMLNRTVQWSIFAKQINVYEAHQNAIVYTQTVLSWIESRLIAKQYDDVSQIFVNTFYDKYDDVTILRHSVMIAYHVFDTKCDTQCTNRDINIIWFNESQDKYLLAFLEAMRRQFPKRIHVQKTNHSMRKTVTLQYISKESWLVGMMNGERFEVQNNTLLLLPMPSKYIEPSNASSVHQSLVGYASIYDVIFGWILNVVQSIHQVNTEHELLQTLQRFLTDHPLNGNNKDRLMSATVHKFELKCKIQKNAWELFKCLETAFVHGTFVDFHLLSRDVLLSESSFALILDLIEDSLLIPSEYTLKVASYLIHDSTLAKGSLAIYEEWFDFFVTEFANLKQYLHLILIRCKLAFSAGTYQLLQPTDVDMSAWGTLTAAKQQLIIIHQIYVCLGGNNATNIILLDTIQYTLLEQWLERAKGCIHMPIDVVQIRE
eukprot:950706_1